ncbi:MAG: YggT family protein [Clostridia bacterium]|jgi:YggT family protein|nr:hypothetical protein [Clostridiales bacterium]MDK2986382.1 YggT family protein [Clostridia bacterium]
MYNLIAIVQVAFRVLDFLIIARVILSWVRVDGDNPVIRFIYESTEPILAPIRRLMPGHMMIDFSPLIAILILEMVEKLVIGLLL